MTIKVKQCRANAILPAYQTSGAAGMDLYACLENTNHLTVEPFQTVMVFTGWKMEIPAGYEGQIRPRSGLVVKKNLTVANAPGTIDSDYRGEVCVLLYNQGPTLQTIRSGDRIAQIVFSRVETVRLELSEELSSTERDSGGFGSTGEGKSMLSSEDVTKGIEAANKLNCSEYDIDMKWIDNFLP